MRNPFVEDRFDFISAIAWAAGGVIVGATAALFLTPRRGNELREIVRDYTTSFIKRRRNKDDASARDAMVNEGGREDDLGEARH
jgi:hypothetical protein